MYYHIEFVPRFVVVGFYSLYRLLLLLPILARDFTSDLALPLVILVSYRRERFLQCEEDIRKDMSYE